MHVFKIPFSHDGAAAMKTFFFLNWRGDGSATNVAKVTFFQHLLDVGSA